MIAIGLVENRLAACVNILMCVHSVYRWQDKIEASDEVALVAKISAAHREKVVKFVCDNHSHEVPCVVFYPIQGGNPEFLNYVAKECTAIPDEE